MTAFAVGLDPPRDRAHARPSTPGHVAHYRLMILMMVFALMIGVAIVLLFGLANMMRGGPGNTSQKLMRARVMLQAIAVIVMVGALWFAR